MDLDDAAIDRLLAELSTLVTAPGALTRALGEEAVALRETKTAARKPRKKGANLDALL